MPATQPPDGQKVVLRRYLHRGREALLWKADGLSEYDLRRPLTPTGTNLLGLVKHVAMMEAGYLGEVFGRPFDGPESWADDLGDDAEPNADLWARPDESSREIVDQYRRVWAHSDRTIADLDLDTVGRVPWWPPERATITLAHALVHMIAENERHAGHADVVREQIDGRVGVRAEADNLAPGDETWWAGYHARVERAAREAAAIWRAGE